jgi:hypothetical protein
MRFLLALFFSVVALGQSTPAVNTPIATTWPLGSVPMWVKVTVTNSSTNFTVTCAGPASFTGICGTSPVAKTAGTTQSVTLFTPATNFVIDNCIIKTATAFTGMQVTLTGTLGITGSLTGCVSVSYDLMAAVAVGNRGIPTVIPSIASFNGTDAAILALTSTVANISMITAGSVVIWMRVVFLP